MATEFHDGIEASRRLFYASGVKGGGIRMDDPLVHTAF